MMTDQTTNRGYPRVVGTRHFYEDVLVLRTMLDMIDADVQAAFNAIATKTGLLSPAFTGTPTAPTPASGDDSDKLATTAFVKAATALAIANLVGASPATLDTLNELAAALGNDPNFATTVATQLGLKLSKDGSNLSNDTERLALANASKMLSFLAQTLNSSQRNQVKANVGLEKWDVLYDLDVNNQGYIDIPNIQLYREIEIDAGLNTAGAASNMGIVWSTDGGTTTINGASAYGYRHFLNGPSGISSGAGSYSSSLLNANYISNLADLQTQIFATIKKQVGKNQWNVLSIFGGGEGGSSASVVGSISSWVSSGGTPASPVNWMRLFQVNAVNFSGHVRIRGLLA